MAIIRRAPLLFILGMGAGCTHPAEHAKAFDPDGNSGADAVRAGALALPLDNPVTDFVSYRKADRTDWKLVEVPAARGKLYVKINWDDANSALGLTVYDALGVEVISGARAEGRSETVEFPVESEGRRYYLRITAPRETDESSYSVIARWTDAAGEPAKTETTATPPETPTAPATTDNPTTPTELDTDNALQGRVVQSYREGDWLILHIDKGSAAGVKSNARGVVLDGASGATPVAGGEFTVVRIVDETRCIARTRLGTLGHNTRVAIEVAP